MTRTLTALLIAVLAAAAPIAAAQVGKSQGVVDVNTVPEAELLKLPHMTPAIVKAILAARPFQSIVDLHTLLTAQKLTPEQTTAFYRAAFVHINLNTATPEEIMLIPGAGKRMAHEFAEYRPWKAWAQFDKEIGKYVDQKEVARLARYLALP